MSLLLPELYQLRFVSPKHIEKRTRHVSFPVYGHDVHLALFSFDIVTDTIAC